MFDIDNFDTYLAKEVVKEPKTGHEYKPVSREERLKKFYAQVEKDKEDGKFNKENKEVTPVDAEKAVEAEDLKLRGNECHAKGEYESAVEFYTTAIRTAANSTLHSNRAASYMMLGWWDQAQRDCKIALRKDPMNERAKERFARCHLAQDDIDGTQKLVGEEEVRRGGPEKLSQGWQRIKWLATKVPLVESVDAVRAVHDNLQKSEMTSPLGRRMRLKLIQALVERSDAIDNKRSIREAKPINRLRKDEQKEEILEIIPYAEEALELTAKVLEDWPEDADCRYWRGRALARLGKQEDAKAQWKRGLQGNSEHNEMKELISTMHNLEEIRQKGNKHYAAGEWNEAINCYSQAIDKDPEAVDNLSIATLHCNRSAAYRKRCDYELALADANTALALRPKYVKALFRRGCCLVEMGRAAEGLTELKVVQRADHTLETLDDWLRRAHCWLAKPKSEITNNHYKLLRAPMDSTQEELRRCYRKAVLQYHPDKNPSEDAAKKFEQVQESFAFLSDEEQRKMYDFGIWRDRPVNHHLKERIKVKEMYDDNMQFEDTWGASKETLGETDSEDEKVIDRRYPNMKNAKQVEKSMHDNPDRHGPKRKQEA
eukprot:gnl/MRDRNA2_/MRDRNA2_51786_c0_seq1.p1 gnl/MRDRNA2_/MRDRNA2_51786_c0~~gnl/MRDRNA2_/MRDRNA2_51786_c0_seq1.p1  ORF type:complete len:600 (+),score=152.36 gnl/MRDRNA2_/MRDRNA2_51786_c0_seq1:102-1901(+)